MWTTILSFLSAPLFNTIAGGWKSYLDSKNTTEAHAVDLAIAEVNAQIAARAEGTKLLIAEQGNWTTRIVRPLFAWPFVIFVWKCVIWDKVLGLGSTDALGGDLSVWASVVVASYFGSSSIEMVARIFKR